MQHSRYVEQSSRKDWDFISGAGEVEIDPS